MVRFEKGMSDSDKRGLIRANLCERGGLNSPSIQCDFYAEFVRRAFPEGTNDDYLAEWAGRFARGDEFHASDSKHKAILLDIMLEGTGDMNAPHLRKSDVQAFCARLGRLKIQEE